MTTVAEMGDFKVTFNGSATYFVIDNNGDCWEYFSTKRKAVNYMKKVA